MPPQENARSGGNRQFGNRGTRVVASGAALAVPKLYFIELIDLVDECNRGLIANCR